MASFNLDYNRPHSQLLQNKADIHYFHIGSVALKELPDEVVREVVDDDLPF
jgi:hypothetical protein